MKTTYNSDKFEKKVYMVFFFALSILLFSLGIKNGSISINFLLGFSIFSFGLAALFLGQLICMSHTADMISKSLGENIKLSAKGHTFIKGEVIIVVSDLELKSTFITQSSLQIVSDNKSGPGAVPNDLFLLGDIQKGKDYVSIFGAEPKEFKE